MQQLSLFMALLCHFFCYEREIVRALPKVEQSLLIRMALITGVNFLWQVGTWSLSIWSFYPGVLIALSIATFIALVVTLLDLTLILPQSGNDRRTLCLRAGVAMVFSVVNAIGLEMFFLKDDIDLFLLQERAAQQETIDAEAQRRTDELTAIANQRRASLGNAESDVLGRIGETSQLIQKLQREILSGTLDKANSTREAIAQREGIGERIHGEGGRFRFAEQAARIAQRQKDDNAKQVQDLVNERDGLEIQLAALRGEMNSIDERTKISVDRIEETKRVVDGKKRTVIQSLVVLMEMKSDIRNGATLIFVSGVVFLFCFIVDMAMVIMRLSMRRGLYALRWETLYTSEGYRAEVAAWNDRIWRDAVISGPVQKTAFDVHSRIEKAVGHLRAQRRFSAEVQTFEKEHGVVGSPVDRHGSHQTALQQAYRAMAAAE